LSYFLRKRIAVALLVSSANPLDAIESFFDLNSGIRKNGWAAQTLILGRFLVGQSFQGFRKKERGFFSPCSETEFASGSWKRVENTSVME
jgi:hypothetical protein